MTPKQEEFLMRGSRLPLKSMTVAMLLAAPAVMAQEPTADAKPDTAVNQEATQENAQPADGTAAPAPAAPSASTTAQTPAAEPASDNGPGLFAPWRFGIYGAATIPHPVTYGVDVMYKRDFSGGVSLGGFDLTLGDVNVGMSHWDVRGRWHPFSGTFFLGLAYGNQSIDVEAKQDIDVTVSGVTQKVNTKINMGVDTTYTTPHIGWMGVWDAGFVLGFEVGYQVAMSSKAKELQMTTANAAANAALPATEDYRKLKKDVEDGAEQIGKTSLPYMALLKIGWML
jgi:hypothetical protein